MTDDKKLLSEAMSAKCGLCKAEPGQPCRNVITDEVLTDRVHYYRIEPK